MCTASIRGLQLELDHDVYKQRLDPFGNPKLPKEQHPVGEDELVKEVLEGALEILLWKLTAWPMAAMCQMGCCQLNLSPPPSV
eukprot:SAG11_NODE_371_length_10051_cov_5.987741_8_plen_83_part_00